MKEILEEIKYSLKYWFYYAWTHIDTVKEAEALGLEHIENIFGDAINHLDCRSLWKDKFGNVYSCKQRY